MKLTQEELKSIKSLQKRQLATKEELGEIGLIQLNLQTRQNQVEAFYTQTLDLEKQIAADIQEKYGKGSIDIETGEFTPVV